MENEKIDLNKDPNKKIETLIKDAKLTLQLYLGAEQVYSGWQNYMMIAQSIFYLVMAQLICCGKLFIAFILCIFGLILTFCWIPHVNRRNTFRITRLKTFKKSLERIRNIIGNEYFSVLEDQEKAKLDYMGPKSGNFERNIAIIFCFLWGGLLIFTLSLIIYQNPEIRKLIFDP